MSDELKTNETKTFEKKEYKPREYRDSRDTRDSREPREGGDKDSKYSSRPYKKRTTKRKICRFCAEVLPVDYTNVRLLKTFITERGKIVPARITGNCAKHQRELTVAIKRARKIALMPYTSSHNV